MANLSESLWENLTDEPLKAVLEKKYYRLKKWPNFGFSRYSPEFIEISAYLSRRFMTKKEILENIDTDERLVNHYLNKSHLLGLLEVKSSGAVNDEDKLTENNSLVSIFTSKLKKFFY